MTESTGSLTLVSPSAQVLRAEGIIAPKLTELAGKRIVFLDNSKSNADLLLAGLSALLHERCETAPGVAVRKGTSPSLPFDDELYDTVVGEYDAAITAMGDCGGCTSGSVRDASALERRGLPTVTLVSEAFSAISELEAEAFGTPAMARVVVRHPFGDLRPDEVSEVARDALAGVIAGLTGEAVSDER